MRTVSKDIMMICKGWYTNREGNSKRQAVENYIKDYLELESYSSCTRTKIKESKKIYSRKNVSKDFTRYI